MDRRQGVDRLDFNDDRTLDQNIDAKSDIKSSITIADGYAYLSLRRQARALQFLCQAMLVN